LPIRDLSAFADAIFQDAGQLFIAGSFFGAVEDPAAASHSLTLSR
jgi:hypothetical protein